MFLKYGSLTNVGVTPSWFTAGDFDFSGWGIGKSRQDLKCDGIFGCMLILP